MTDYNILVDLWDNRDKFEDLPRRHREAVRKAYRDGMSDGSEYGAAIMAERADLVTFEHAMIEQDAATSLNRRERAYHVGRLRGFRDVTRTLRGGRWTT